MKTIELAADSELARQLPTTSFDEDVVIALFDGTEFIVTRADDFAEEVARTRNNAALMEELDRLSQDPTRIPLEQIRRELLGD